MEFDFQILRMTSEFYQAYPSNAYPELLIKDRRSYTCLLIDLHYDYYVCIPFRTEIRHKNAYKFMNSNRSKAHQSGLDYTKMIIVKNPEYIGNTDSVVDKDEYNETNEHINTIVSDADKYIQEYVGHQKGLKILDKRDYDRKYRYSSLQYFHRELGIDG